MIKNKLIAGIIVLLVTIILLSACSTSETDTEPDLVGWIDDVQQAQGGGKLGQLLVNSPDNKTSDKFIVTVTDETMVGVQVGGSQHQADFDILIFGQKVEIWFSGPVMESYPAQVTAERIIITDTSNVASTVGIGIPCDEFYSQPNITKELDVNYPALLVVTLCSNPTTGFQWFEKAQISDITVLEQKDHKLIVPESEAPPSPGTPGQEVWTFKTLKEGSGTIFFEYSRPWEGGEKGEWTCTVDVIVK